MKSTEQWVTKRFQPKLRTEKVTERRITHLFWWNSACTNFYYSGNNKNVFDVARKNSLATAIISFKPKKANTFSKKNCERGSKRSRVCFFISCRGQQSGVSAAVTQLVAVFYSGVLHFLPITTTKRSPKRSSVIPRGWPLQLWSVNGGIPG